MNYALILTLFAVSAVYGASASTCLPCAAATNSPIQGTIQQQNGQICCVSDGQAYFCQTQTAAAGNGGLLKQLKLTGPLCEILNGLDLALTTNLKVILACAQGQTITCTPPSPSTPNYCTTVCTSGVCCVKNKCPA